MQKSIRSHKLNRQKNHNQKLKYEIQFGLQTEKSRF